MRKFSVMTLVMSAIGMMAGVPGARVDMREPTRKKRVDLDAMRKAEEKRQRKMKRNRVGSRPAGQFLSKGIK